MVLSRSLNDDRLYKMEQERSNLQQSLIQTSSHYDQLTSEKHGLTVALDDLRRKFDIEKRNLLDELEMLREARKTFEQDKLSREQELTTMRDRSRTSLEELQNAQTRIQLLEQQLNQQLKQNKDLNDELRHVKLESTDLQRSLTDYHLTSRERDRLQDSVGELEKELNTLRLELKSQDSRYNETQFLHNKLSDEKTALMKEVVRLENLTKDLERELDQLRYTLRERNDALQQRDKDLAALRKKELNFRSTVENLQRELNGESTRNKDLDEQLKQLQRQLNVESQNTLATKRELNEYGLRNTRLQDEIGGLRRDKEHLASHLGTLQQRLKDEEALTGSLQTEIQELEGRVQEIDRLKSLEDSIQSQRWDDMSQMASTMQTVSRTMARATSPTALRKRVELQ